MEFRRQAGDAIREVVEGRLDEIAGVLPLTRDELRKELCPYADPDKISHQNYDGTFAELGIKIPRNWKRGWQFYFYLWLGDEDAPRFCALVWFKQPGLALEKLRIAAGKLRMKPDELWADEEEARIYEYIPAKGPHTLSSTAEVVVDRWVKLWRRAGGLAQFLPKVNNQKPTVTRKSKPS